MSYLFSNRLLARSWSDSYPSLSDADFKQRMEKKKQLLILAYSGQPEVQAYLHVAPFAYITQDIQKKERLGEELPTVSEYRKHQWFTSANVTHPAMKSSYFTVWAETYPAIYVPHDTSLFRRLYSDIRNAEILGGGNWSKISFVNGNLIDEADAVGEAEANRDKVLKR